MKRYAHISLALAAVCIFAACGPAENKNLTGKAPGTGSKVNIAPKTNTENREVRKIVSGMSLEDRIGEMILLEFQQINYIDPAISYTSLMGRTPEELDVLIRENGLEGSYDAAAMASALDPSKLETVYPYYLLSLAISKNSEVRVDPQKAQKLFGELHVGGILNMIGGDEATPAATWRRVMRDLDSLCWAYAGKPCVYGLDEIHGTTYVSDGTLFPQPINMAATFNRDLVRSMGKINSYENRAAGVHWIYGPVLDVAVRPTWSRNYETFGEDPYLASELGVEYVRAMQDGEDGGVGVCLKHYMGYSAPDNGIDRNPASVSIPDIRDIHFYPYVKSIQAGALSVMTNSSILNGESGIANKTYLTDWLKKGLDWDGVVVTDWADIDAMVSSQHTAASIEEALERAVNAGVDMIMVPSQLDYGEKLLSLVEQGRISKKRICDACTRIVRMKYRMGLYERIYPSAEDYPLLGSEEFAAESYKAAVESQVLLKNENNVLPLKEGTRILVCGPNADSMRPLHGGWSYTWQGSNAEKFTSCYNTILDALRARFGEKNVDYEPGVEYDFISEWYVEKPADLRNIKTKAAKADCIIVCAGENSYAETQGSIHDANLSAQQKALIREAAAGGKPVILCLAGGRARIIADVEPLCAAVVDMLLPGVHGGDALAALLSGEENFSGRLPYSYPLEPNAFTTYNYKVCERRATIPGIYNYSAHTYAQWWFGEGLSYTDFEYSGFSIDKSSFTPQDELTFTVTVKNAGERAGKESVLLYTSDESACISPCNRRLAAFEKIELAPGESRTVSLTIPATQLSFADAAGRLTMESGKFVALCGGQFLEFNCTGDWHE